MKLKLVGCAVCLLLRLQADPPVTTSTEDAKGAGPIAAHMVERASKQRSELLGYSAMRRYTLRNHHLLHDASITALLVYQSGKGKHFSVVREEQVTGIVQHVLNNILKEEEERSRPDPSQGDVTPSNYKFALLGEEIRDGRMCYRLKLVPRRKNKFLIVGDLWVDTKVFAIVCMSGRPSKSVSFWIGRPFVEQHFEPVNGFWVPSRNESTAQVKLAGRTELTIDCWDYKFRSTADPVR